MAQTVTQSDFSSNNPRKFLTFSLADEEYGISIMRIKEIIGMMPVTVLPQTPDYVKGVINLRGKVIPIIDLRGKFNLDPAQPTERTCIIVIETEVTGTTSLVGLIIDAVSEVINLSSADIEPAPATQTELNHQLIYGLAKCESGVKILLDIDEVINPKELGEIANSAN